MARASTTRQRVHEAAHALAAEGQEPTVARVRALLGGGSPNTITEELRRWREARKHAAPGAEPTSQIDSPTGAPIGISELIGLLGEARGLAGQSRAALSEVQGLREALDRLREALEQQLSQMNSLESSAAREQQLQTAAMTQLRTQFEGVQRYMLKSLDETREETRGWKERALRAEQELDTWRGTLSQRLEQARLENAELKGQLRVFVDVSETGRLSGVPPRPEDLGPMHPSGGPPSGAGEEDQGLSGP